jgi:zinc/manganese transport system substrate-binding protein
MRGIVMLVVLGAVGLCGCAIGAPSGAATPIRIVVAENTWGGIVGEVAQPYGAVTSIVHSPSADPHDYEATPSDARDVAEARYVVLNGLGYDTWAQRLLDANPDSHRIVLNVGARLHFSADANPHVWYSPAAVAAFAKFVAADLARLDPAHRAQYAANEKQFMTHSLAEYHRLIASIAARDAGVPIGGSESLIEPIAAALGLRVITPPSFLRAVAEGGEPTAADKATIDAQIAGHEIRVLVYNSQNATPDVQRIVGEAQRANIPIVAFTETPKPADATFEAWQVAQLRALAQALETR